MIMKERIKIRCAECGKEFKGVTAKYCPECREEVRGRHLRQTERKASVRKCKECGKEFAGYTTSRYCAACQKGRTKASNRRAGKRYRQKHPHQHKQNTCNICGKPIPRYHVFCTDCRDIKKTCPNCKKVFTTHRNDKQVFCTKDCYNEFIRGTSLVGMRKRILELTHLNRELQSLLKAEQITVDQLAAENKRLKRELSNTTSSAISLDSAKPRLQRGQMVWR